MLFAELFGQSSKQGPSEVSIRFPFLKSPGDTASFQHSQTADSLLCGTLHLYCDWFMHSDSNYLEIHTFMLLCMVTWLKFLSL